MGSPPAGSTFSVSNTDLENWRIRDIDRARRNLSGIAACNVTVDLLNSICDQLNEIMPTLSDPDMVLNNLERFFIASRSRLATAALLDRDRTALPIITRIFSTSQYLSDLLIRDCEAYDALRLTEGQPIAREALVDDLCSETDRISDFQQMAVAIRRFKQRETLRVAYGDIIADQQIRVVSRQISYIADAVSVAASNFVWRKLVPKFGTPLNRQGESCAYTILALGKLGGNELNYSSDIDLIFFYEVDSETTSGKSNRQFFDRLAQEFTKLLTEPSSAGTAYRVDWRLRPDGKQGAMTMSSSAALNYYENKGRSWERQAFVKARPIAGCEIFGRDLLQQLNPWIYQSRWSRVEIESMTALKRKIERRAVMDGQEELNVKTGFGGIRDIEFTIQFLQLLNGASLPQVQTNNTLDAIDRLQSVGSLNLQEHAILIENYSWLRKLEHRLQIMSDLQKHSLPENPKELARVAMRMGYAADGLDSALNKFRSDFRQLKKLNRGILDHLLQGAFGSETQEKVPIEVDLILDQHPSVTTIDAVLTKHGFKNTSSAYSNLNSLANETIPFLSPRRCRHFLAAIASPLLIAISQTPDPDQTLSKLRCVSESIGGKGTLWELFRILPATMQLFVKLCAACRYLTDILIRQPGMLDSLIDSLTLEQLPSFSFLQDTIRDLTNNAEDHDPILYTFKYDQHLRVGVRDIIGRDPIEKTHQALSDTAEVLLQTIAGTQLENLVEKHGHPQLESGGECELVILALGKLGGRQPNYHSDLDVVFLYQSNGKTDSRTQSTSNQHFFSMVGTQVIHSISKTGSLGRLYELDCRLRPTGKSGAIAVSFDEFARYFESGTAQAWERLAMCTARPVFGSSIARKQATHLVTNAIQSKDWSTDTVEELRQMRIRMQDNCSSSNLKRAVGGTVDVEFIIQMLQLKHGRQFPEVLQSGTLRAGRKLAQNHLLMQTDYDSLGKSYSYLRDVEARIRLMNTSARHDFPDDTNELKKLTYLLNEPSIDSLREKTEGCRKLNRQMFDKYFS